ncbi:MAG: hypothetical protein R3C15_10685 [Thermoleophilia bacterium]
MDERVVVEREDEAEGVLQGARAGDGSRARLRCLIREAEQPERQRECRSGRDCGILAVDEGQRRVALRVEQAEDLLEVPARVRQFAGEDAAPADGLVRDDERVLVALPGELEERLRELARVSGAGLR